MASNSAVQIAEPTPLSAPDRRRWSPLRLRQQPFFDDKNRAFWILQSAGWAGYFILRTLSGLANSMAWSFILHPALLTAPGFAGPLVMAAIYRRVIRRRPLVAWAVSVVIVVMAAAAFSAIETWSHATFIQ